VYEDDEFDEYSINQTPVPYGPENKDREGDHWNIYFFFSFSNCGFPKIDSEPESPISLHPNHLRHQHPTAMDLSRKV